jgi:phosphonate transport system ATP-binding protein
MRYGRIIFDDAPAKLDAAAMERIYSGIPAEDRRADAPSAHMTAAQIQAQPS